MSAAGEKTKVCIFGAGAIGAYLACGLLENAAAACTLSIVARGANLAAIRSQGGIRIRQKKNQSSSSSHSSSSSAAEEMTERLVRCDVSKVTNKAADLGVQDFVIVCLKSYQAYESVEEMLPLLGPHTAVVTGQNGLPWWYFFGDTSKVASGKTTLSSVDADGRQWRLIGPERAIGIIIYPATELIEPGLVLHEYGRKFTVGEPSGQTTARITRLSQLLKLGGFEAPIRDNIRVDIWKKLWGNCVFNPVSVVTEATLDVIIADPATRLIAEQIMQEALDVCKQLGVEVNITIETRINGAKEAGAHKTSMLVDYQRYQTLELDALCGSVQEVAGLVGVKTPILDTVVALVRQKDAVHKKKNNKL